MAEVRSTYRIESSIMVHVNHPDPEDPTPNAGPASATRKEKGKQTRTRAVTKRLMKKYDGDGSGNRSIESTVQSYASHIRDLYNNSFARKKKNPAAGSDSLPGSSATSSAFVSGIATPAEDKVPGGSTLLYVDTQALANWREATAWEKRLAEFNIPDDPSWLRPSVAAMLAKVFAEQLHEVN